MSNNHLHVNVRILQVLVHSFLWAHIWDHIKFASIEIHINWYQNMDTYQYMVTYQNMDTCEDEYIPTRMVVEHRLEGMTHILLVGCESGVQVFIKVLRQVSYDDGRVCDFLSIQFNERQLTLFWFVFHLMVDVLKDQQSVKSNFLPVINFSSMKSISLATSVYLIWDAIHPQPVFDFQTKGWCWRDRRASRELIQIYDILLEVHFMYRRFGCNCFLGTDFDVVFGDCLLFRGCVCGWSHFLLLVGRSIIWCSFSCCRSHCQLKTGQIGVKTSLNDKKCH